MRSSRRLVFLWQHDSSFANTGLSKNGLTSVVVGGSPPSISMQCQRTPLIRMESDLAR